MESHFPDLILQGLYHLKHNNWQAAHNIAENLNCKHGKWLHAILHKIEGDQWNSNYWYRQAGVKSITGSVEAEWEAIARSYLKDHNSISP